MKVTLAAVRTALGNFVEEQIVCGLYGNVFLTSNGFRVGDPCYWMSNEDYADLRTAALAQEPDAYNGRCREWVKILWRNQPCFFRTQSDGDGDFGCCVDSGWVVAVHEKSATPVVETLVNQLAQ